jgi:hypothetical protein
MCGTFRDRVATIGRRAKALPHADAEYDRSPLPLQGEVYSPLKHSSRCPLAFQDIEIPFIYNSRATFMNF